MNDVSIILALYNEEKNARPVIDQIFEHFGSDTELVVIDDGSTDGTEKEIPKESCVFIKHEVNQGKGIAIKNGVAKASKEIIAFIDGDLQDNPEDLIAVCDLVRRGSDMAIGSRFMKMGDTDRFDDKAVKPINEFGNKSLTRIINFLFRGKLTDTQASLKAFKAEKLKALPIAAKRYEIETELVIRSLKRKYSIAEHPVRRYERAHGISNLFDIPFGRLRFALRATRIIFCGFFIWK